MRSRHLLILFAIELVFAAISSALSDEEHYDLAISSMVAGDMHSAVYHFERITSIDSHPQASFIYTNYATAIQAVGGGDGEEQLVSAIRHDETNVDAHFYLGILYQDGNNNFSAETCYKAALELDPFNWESSANLGAVYHDLGDFANAVDQFGNAIVLLEGELEPTNAPLGEKDRRSSLSDLHYRLGYSLLTYDPQDTKKCTLASSKAAVPCLALASNSFSRALQFNSENHAAEHLLSTLTKDSGMERASNEYVRQLFDEYSTNFENSLVNDLKYDGFRRVRGAFDRVSPKRKKRLYSRAIDIGCGTGLLGVEFRNVTKHLTGVDLSSKILEEAIRTRPGLYDSVFTGDAIEALSEIGPFDLVIAADSLIYIGDLTDLFSAVAGSLWDATSLFVFSLEKCSKKTVQALGANDWKFNLQPSGRFCHNDRTVHKMIKEANMVVERYESMEAFRSEGGKPVDGHIFVARLR